MMVDRTATTVVTGLTQLGDYTLELYKPGLLPFQTGCRVQTTR